MTSNDQPMDYAPSGAKGDGSGGKRDLEENVLRRATWIRFLYMVLYVFLYAISRLVTGAVVTVQFFTVLISGRTNARLRSLGHSLAIYSYEVINYLTFNTERKPFPLEADWPTELQVASDDKDDGLDRD